jgi:uncharacterized membrane protein
MTLEPLLEAPLVVQIHVATVAPALLIGAWQIFLSRKGAPSHRALGAAYLCLMAVSAASALFIRAPLPFALPNVAGFNPIHLLAAWVLFGIGQTIYATRTHNVAMHRASMLGIYFGGIGVAGALAVLIPGRIMHETLFGS